jgi:hypothetical protein
MATLQLEQLECIHPDDRVGHDEVYVTVDCDGSSETYNSGERRMREGDTQELTTPGGIAFTDVAVIRLFERDVASESLGSVSIGHPLPDGSQTAYLPSEIGGPHATCYRLTYHVDADEEDAPRRRNRIELLSLKCDDAQGTHDTVYLYVNDDLVWGPANMWTGTERSLGTLSIDFRSSATVRLQETRGEGWQSAFTLRYGEGDYRINTTRTQRFHVDRGITGDATYTLTYRLRRLPAR